MRTSSILWAVTAICLIGTAAPSARAQGRAYIERERQIVKMTKAMVQENREVKEFADLLKELDSADLGESTREFWQTAREVRESMERELRQARERLQKQDGHREKRISEAKVQKAEAAEMTVLDSSEAEAANESPLAKRVHRMEWIIRETDGLRNPMSMNDKSVMARYRLLVGEFHDLMEADVDEMKEEIETLKKEQRAARR